MWRNTWNKVLMVLIVGNLFASIDTKFTSREGKSRRRKPESHPRRNASSVRISPDPMMTGPESGQMDFDRSIEDMVSQVRNNPNLSISKCVVDRKLWMSNSRSLSPWSYRISRDEARKPEEIPEAVCACVGCINPFTMQEDRSMSSVLIYAQIPVRRLTCHRTSARHKRKKSHCVPRFRLALESIAVGCTCIVG